MLRIQAFLFLLAVLALPGTASAQTQRWVYTHDGPGNQWDQSWRVICREDTTVYVCGDCQLSAIPFTFDMTVVGLTEGGDERWTYKYSGPGPDQAYDVVAGSDGNLYVVGSSFDLSTSNDFTVLSVDDTGAQRWVYRHANPGIDLGRALVQGADGNIFASGTSEDYGQFTVISLTPGGQENWVFGRGPGEALAIAAGPDSSVYAAGYAVDSLDNCDIAVAAVLSDGDEKWFYRYDGPGHSGDSARAIAVGSDGRVYVCGHSRGAGTDLDFATICLDPSDGSEMWVHRYDGPGNSYDVASSLVAGEGVYVGGISTLAGSFATAFTVLALTDSGTERWVYCDTGGRAAALNIVAALAQDQSGNLYAAGEMAGTETTRYDAVVTSLTGSGTLRWRYMYAGPDTVTDYFSSVTVGPDGNIYASGTTGDPPDSDWLVVSLTQSGAVRETRPVVRKQAFAAGTVFRDEIHIRCAAPSDNPLHVALSDILGRTVFERKLAATPQQVALRNESLRRLGAGLYFLRLETDKTLSQIKLIKP